MKESLRTNPFANRLTVSIEVNAIKNLGFSSESLEHIGEESDIWEALDETFGKIHDDIKTRFWNILQKGDRRYLHQWQYQSTEGVKHAWDMVFAYNLPVTERPALEIYLSSVKVGESSVSAFDRDLPPDRFLGNERAFWKSLSKKYSVAVTIGYICVSNLLPRCVQGGLTIKDGTEHPSYTIVTHDLEIETAV